MGRLESRCCGDCGSCELLRHGEVDMIPCVLDQIFQRMQKVEKRMTALESASKSDKIKAFASVAPSIDNQNM